jgi:mannosyltransferase
MIGHHSPCDLSDGAPAVAILIGVALGALRHRLAVTALVLVAAVALPQIVAQRMPEAKQQSSWNETAGLLTDQRALDQEWDLTDVNVLRFER